MKKKLMAINLGHMAYEAALSCQHEHVNRILNSVTKHQGSIDMLHDMTKHQGSIDMLHDTTKHQGSIDMLHDTTKHQGSIDMLHDTTKQQELTKRNRLLLVEHPAVYTVGLRQDRYQSIEAERLRALGAQFIKTNRGGLITFHGPGQLVIYPIMYLKDFNMTIKSYIKKLESTIMNACRQLRVDTDTRPETGVWVGNAKLAAIGVHASQYVVSHGLALNCNTDLQWFDHIVPCGIVGKGVTSLSRELGRDVTPTEVVDPILQSFAVEFDCEIENM